MTSSRRALLVYGCILLAATCGLPLLLSYLYFAAQPTSFVLLFHDGSALNWFQIMRIASMHDTLVQVSSPPPLDLWSLEQYTKHPQLIEQQQPILLQSIRQAQQQQQQHLGLSSDKICLEYQTLRYCSSSTALSGIYVHESSGQSIRLQEVVPASSLLLQRLLLPFLRNGMPATSLLLLLQTALAISYWNNRVSPSAVGLLRHQEEPWRLFTGATAHFDGWHFGMNMMTLHSLGTALENKGVWNSISFLAANVSLILYTGILWWFFQRYLVASPDQHCCIPTVGYSGVLFAWLVVLSLEHGTVCPIFFLPQLCFSSIPVWNGLSVHPGPVIQLVMMQVLLPRASWTGHLAGILVGFLLQWRILPLCMWWPSFSIPLMHFLWCMRQKRDRFLSLRLGSSSSWYVCMGIVHGLLWVASILTLDGFGSTLTLEYLVVVLWWCSTRSEDTTMARGYILLAVLVLVTDAMTIGAWTAVLRPVFTFMIPSVATLLFRMIALLTSLVWMVHSQRLYQEEATGIFYYVFHWTVLKPARGILLGSIGTTTRTNSGDSTTTWDQLGPGRRLGGTHDAEMVQLI